MSTAAITIENVDIFFGKTSERAQALALEGKNREEILAATGSILGVSQGSLTVEEGQICVLMGLSGSGKSTLLRGVNGLNPVSSGSIKVRHQGQLVDIASCSEATLRNVRMTSVAMVFQQFGLLPWRTVRDNVGLGLELRGLDKNERREIVTEKLEMVGLSSWGDKYIRELSGGMQQRVGLARAFATDAPILLMDEPFSALDPLTRQHLQDELLYLQKTLKKTIIFVSHDMDEALKIGSKIVMMEGGRIIQKGAPEDVIQNPANDYVRRFISHMNPISVMKCSSVMIDLSELNKEGSERSYEGDLRLYLDSSDNIESISNKQGEAIPLTFYDNEQSHWQLGTVVAVPSSLSLKTAIKIKQESQCPLLVVDHQRCLGVIGDKEIYSSLVLS